MSSVSTLACSVPMSQDVCFVMILIEIIVALVKLHTIFPLLKPLFPLSKPTALSGLSLCSRCDRQRCNAKKSSRRRLMQVNYGTHGYTNTNIITNIVRIWGEDQERTSVKRSPRNQLFDRHIILVISASYHRALHVRPRRLPPTLIEMISQIHFLSQHWAVHRRLITSSKHHPLLRLLLAVRIQTFHLARLQARIRLLIRNT